MTLLLGLLFLGLQRLTALMDGLAWPSRPVIPVRAALAAAPSRQATARRFHAPTPQHLT